MCKLLVHYVKFKNGNTNENLINTNNFTEYRIKKNTYKCIWSKS